MNLKEMEDIMKCTAKLDVSKMEIQDQLMLMAAYLNFAETMEPLVIKYSGDLPEDAKFIIKM